MTRAVLTLNAGSSSLKHQPHNLAGIRAAKAAYPGVPQVACFDTAFHRTNPRVSDSFALPRALYDEGVRRYGFHGLSYAYIAGELARRAPHLAGGRVIVAHLGNGASMCALLNGRSMASTMGFTALDGLPMGTRCGQVDPGVLLYLMDQKGMTAAQISDLLYRQSGLLGLSGLSNDMRTLEAATSDDGALAAGSSETALFIRPGYRFKAVDALITNFHLPGSTLMMLVAAFAGLDAIKAAYAHAVAQRYRFFSYGDAMLLERAK